MTFTYCRKHDIALCASHADECFGGDRCDQRPDDRPEFCSVCSGILLPKAARPR